ncbi:MAG: c-type cytochrome [Acidobacteriota bacterium]|nr:c-type cytochrome [Acidobacteriota bacterium]
MLLTPDHNEIEVGQACGPRSACSPAVRKSEIAIAAPRRAVPARTHALLLQTFRGLLLFFVLATGMACAAGDAAKGKDLFETCASCHNVANDERKMGPSLRTLFGKVTLRNGKHVDDDNVRQIVLDGYNGMPSFRYSFRPAEIDDLMAYLHTLTGKPAAAITDKGEGYFRAYCLRCHNPDSRTAPGPDLRGGFKPEWSGIVEDGHAGTPPIREWLDTSARAALIEYLRKY